jgi:hypothetical protein
MIAVLHRLILDPTETTPGQTLGNVTEIIDAVRDQHAIAARDAMLRHLEHAVTHYRVGKRHQRGAARAASR